MSEELKSVEVENALTTIFQKIDTVENTVTDLIAKNADAQATANHALSVAKSAKSAINSVRTVPTNGFDVFLGIIQKTTVVVGLGIAAWATVKCVQAFSNAQAKKVVHETHYHPTYTTKYTASSGYVEPITAPITDDEDEDDEE